MKSSRWRFWYPPSWRNRFGDEYEQLLDDLGEDGRRAFLTRLDIIRTGIALHASTSDGRRRLFGATAVFLSAIIAVLIPLLAVVPAGASPALNVITSHKCSVVFAIFGPAKGTPGGGGGGGEPSPWGCNSSLQANNQVQPISLSRFNQAEAFTADVRGDSIFEAFNVEVNWKTKATSRYTVEIQFPKSVTIKQYVGNGSTWVRGSVGKQVPCYSVLARQTNAGEAHVQAVVVAINEYGLEPFTECSDAYATGSQSPPFTDVQGFNS